MITILNEDLIKLKKLINEYNFNIDVWVKNVDKLNNEEKIHDFVLTQAIAPIDCFYALDNIYSCDENGIYDYNDDIYMFTSILLGYSIILGKYNTIYVNNKNFGPTSNDGKYLNYNYFANLDFDYEYYYKWITIIIDQLEHIIIIGNKLNQYANK